TWCTPIAVTSASAAVDATTKGLTLAPSRVPFPGGPETPCGIGKDVASGVIPSARPRKIRLSSATTDGPSVAHPLLPQCRGTPLPRRSEPSCQKPGPAPERRPAAMRPAGRTRASQALPLSRSSFLNLVFRCVPAVLDLSQQRGQVLPERSLRIRLRSSPRCSAPAFTEL